MKLRKLFLAVIAGAALLTACDKKEVDLGPAKLTVNPTDVSFTQQIASQEISLLATRDWAVTGLPDWIALSKEAGSANTDAQKISISVTENKGNNRSASLIFSIGFARSVLNVTQEGPDGEVDNGDGSKANPFNVEGVIAYVTELGQAESDKNVYVKGQISSISEEFTTQYGNGNFTISEDGTTDGPQFTAYRVLYLGNKKFASGDTQIKLGDDVILYGKVVNYNGKTPETVQGSAFLFSLNGVDKGGDEGGQGGTGEAKGTGTLEDPFNPAGAAAAVATLTWTDKDNYEKTEPVYIKGKISKVSTTFEGSGSYGNASFTIVDETDGTGSFEVFQTYYLGNRQWKTGDTDVKENDIVIVYGPIMNYKGNTPETVGKGASYIYSLNGTTDGGGQGGNTGTPSGDGTQANPYNVAAAVAAVKDLTWTSNTDFQKVGPFYVKGKVSSVKFFFDAEHGTATFNISDDGTTSAAQFACYSVKYYDGAAWVEGNTQVTVGADVVIYGELQNYKGNTPETVTGSYVVNISGGGVTPPPAEHDGLTLETAFTASEANAWIMANIEGNGNTGETKYYVKGKIQRFYQKSGVDQNFAADATYHQASFYITDDGAENKEKEFEAFQINYLAGATFDATKDTDVKVGDEVVIYGPLAKYNTTAETAGKGAAYLYSLNAGGQGGGGGQSGDANTIKLTNENTWAEGTDATYGKGFEMTASNGVKFGVYKHKSTSTIVTPDQYAARVYKSAVIVVTAPEGKNITSLSFKASDLNSGQYCVDLTFLEGGTGVLAADKTAFTVGTFSGSANKIVLQAAAAQARLAEAVIALDGEGGGQGGGGGEGGEGGDTPAKPVNEGTLESPFTVADALIAAKDADLTGKEYYVKAVIGKDISIKNGTASFELVDGTTTEKLTVVKAKSFKGAAFDGTEPIDWLDEVILKGKVTEYSTLPALTEGELVKWNGKTMFKAAFTTIAQLNALVTSTATEYTGTLENAVVSFVPDTKNAIIKDATGSILYYKNTHGLKQGQTFSGDVTVKVVLYNNASEMTAMDAVFTGDEAAVDPESVALSALAADFAKYQNAYVKVKDLEVVSVDKKNISVKNGNDTYVVYSNAGNATVEVGKTITATGTICQYSGKGQIKAWTMDAVEVQTQAAATYVKVTSAPSDWSGTYLLVCDSAKKAFNGFSGTYGTGADVTITEGVIESDATVDTYQIVIDKATKTSGAYIIKLGTKFLNWTSGNSLTAVDEESSNANWNITYDSGSKSVYIVNAADATRKIRWNNGSPRFACYTSAQTDVQLYKYTE